MVVTKGSRPEPHKVLIPEGRTLQYGNAPVLSR
jgi:hypothetical protein